MAMEVEFVGCTKGKVNLPEEEGFQEGIFSFAQPAARICYSELDWGDLVGEKRNPKLVAKLINAGHHSIFEHWHGAFYLRGIPKILAMVLNNEKLCATSEKSGRYTIIGGVDDLQEDLRRKWFERFVPIISEIYPGKCDRASKDVEKLALENARYMVSVFTPTKMLHTVNARQLNFLRSQFADFYEKNSESKDHFKSRLAKSMREFVELTNSWNIEGLVNMTDRHLSLFRDVPVKEQFSDNYSTNYRLSFVGLGELQRHRTLHYNITAGAELGAPLGFFVPYFIRDKPALFEEWQDDLQKIASYDFPQAQLLSVSERGDIEDFRSRCILRLCGRVQPEVMRNVLQTGQKYVSYRNEVAKWLRPKCQQGMKCEGCAFGGARALERLV
jgi:hypothetical protein